MKTASARQEEGRAQEIAVSCPGASKECPSEVSLVGLRYFEPDLPHGLRALLRRHGHRDRAMRVRLVVELLEALHCDHMSNTGNTH